MLKTLVFPGILLSLMFTLQVPATAEILHTISDSQTYGGPSLLDFEGDGDLDILHGSVSGEDHPPLYWYINDGQGQFTLQESQTLFHRCDASDAGDLDSDGDIDFVVLESEVGVYPELTWYENIGSGSYLAHDLLLDHGGFWVKIVDFDGDGDLDIITTATYSEFPPQPSLRLFQNNGEGFFQEFTYTNNVIGSFSRFDTGDLDGDGDADIVALGGSRASILWNNGSFFNMDRENLFPYAFYSDGVAVADVDLDADIDLIFHNIDTTIVAFNNNDGNFIIHRMFPDFDAALWAGIAATDWELDGDVDILVGAYRRYTNQENMEFTPDPSDLFIGDLLLGDMDSDGDLDCVRTIGDELAWIENETDPGVVTIGIVPQPGGISLPTMGGTFRYSGTLWNQLSSPKTGYIWAEVRGPGGTTVRPWARPIGVLPGVTYQSLNIEQEVPAGLPSGTYTYFLRAGRRLSTPLVSDSLVFTIGTGLPQPAVIPGQSGQSSQQSHKPWAVTGEWIPVQK